MKKIIKVTFFAMIFLILVLIPSKTNADYWYPLNSGVKEWSAIDSSSTGQYLVATALNDYIYTSDDYGITWTQQNSIQNYWSSVASDSTGQYLVAVAENDYIYTSDDYGITWTQQNSIQNYWSSVASDSTGQYLVATGGVSIRGIRSSYIYTSNDYGITWIRQQNSLDFWVSVASSSNGQYLVAAAQNRYIYTSNDYGITWIQSIGAGDKWWWSVATSSDGSRLMAVEGAGEYDSSGYVHISTDYGNTWSQYSIGDNIGMMGISSSSDGMKLVAVGAGGWGNKYIYFSNDGGQNWNPELNANNNWISVTSSSDGKRHMAIAIYEDSIYLSDGSPIIIYSGSLMEDYNYKNGSIFGSRIITLYSDTFSNVNGTLTEGVHYILESVPIGLTPVMSIDELGQTATLTFTGNAINHNDENDVDNLKITFLDGAFTNTTTASDVIGYSNNQGNINFLTTNFQGISTLYASDGAGGNENGVNLYILDSNNGDIIETVGPTGHNINGMAFSPTGVLYGSTSNNDYDGSKPKSLFIINKDTGAATWLGTIKDGNGKAWSFPDLTFRSDGTLFGWGNDGGNGQRDLYTIDTICPENVCLATKFGNLVVDLGLNVENWQIGGGGIAFDLNDNLYLFEAEQSLGFMLKIDSVTGEILEQIPYENISEDGSVMMAAKFDGDDTLFAARSYWGVDPADLVIIDVNTGYITSVGENETMPKMTALAFYLDPEDTCSDGLLNQDETGIDTGGICTPAPTPQKRKSTGSSASVMATFQQEQQARAQAVGLPTTPVITSPNTTAPTNPITLTRTLKYGMQGDDVKALQVYLNTHNYLVSLTGAGSLGNETTYFGLKTKQAVIRFQLANGLVGDGIVGLKTKEKMK